MPRRTSESSGTSGPDPARIRARHGLPEHGMLPPLPPALASNWSAALLIVEALVPKTLRNRARYMDRPDGLKVRVIDDPAAPVVDVGHALRLLARMLVRAHQADGDHQAIVRDTESSSDLTVVHSLAPHHDDHEAA